MKKLFKILTLALVAAVCAVGLFACEDGGSDSGKSGLLYKMYEGDDFYTVYKYVKVEGETELNIGDFNKDGVVIKRIKKGAFKDNDTLVKITVPDTVETIDGGAFANMTALKELDLPFIGKTAVADVYLNSTPDDKATEKSVGGERNFGYIFGTEEYDGGVKCDQNYDATNTATYYLPDTLRVVKVNPKADNYGIPMYAFAGNAWVNEIVLSDNVKEIGEAAFKDNVYAAEVNLGKITKIYDNAFNGAKYLTAADITGLTEEMGNNCFTNCTALKTVSVNSDIKADAFNGCTALTTLNIGENVKIIGARAFYGCDNLIDEKITVAGAELWQVNNFSKALNSENIKENYNFAWSR